jgi:hypothetical protein
MTALLIPAPPKKERVIQLRLTPREFDEIERASKKNKVSKSRLLRFALRKIKLKIAVE